MSEQVKNISGVLRRLSQVEDELRRGNPHPMALSQKERLIKLLLNHYSNKAETANRSGNVVASEENNGNAKNF